MGIVDTEGKKYLSNKDIFADAFNYLVYNGEEVIKAENLRELNSSEISVPYGNNIRVPIQKYRDILNLWNVMTDNKVIYVILGAEIQDKVHYGMPVKDGLYDMIGYSRQIEEIKRSYNKNKESYSEGEFVVDNGILKIKLSSEEFLSGLKKGDKLIPIITAVIFLGDKQWDGPRSLHEMLDIQDKRLKEFIPDYKINLISPAEIVESDFGRFKTNFGFAMKVIKHQREDADSVIFETNHRKIDRDTAFFLNRVVKLDLEYDEKEGDVDMCEALQRRYKEYEVVGAIEMLRDDGKSDEDIINRIIKKYNVTKDYVLNIMSLKLVK